MKLRLTTRAYNDLASISTFLEERNPSAATAFFAVFERLFADLQSMPRCGRPTDIPDVRCLAVPRLPYKMFYRVTADTIEILTIFHTARDPREAV